MMGPDLSRSGPLRQWTRQECQAPVLSVARRLLGALIVREEPDGTATVARIVETEAYCRTDRASHSWRGPTAANASMFGPAGHAYVYLIYGLHHCLNVTCDPEQAAAVLLRAGVVVAGNGRARARRPHTTADAAVAAGPAKLTAALGVDRSIDGIDLCAPGRLWLAHDDLVVPDGLVHTGARVGVRHDPDLPWRLWISGVAAVSRYRRHRKA